MASTPTFTAPGGRSPEEDIRLVIAGLRPTQSDLLMAGHLARTEIRDKSFGGIDALGSPFVPYSPGYVKQKGQTNVDLYSRGASAHMLDALSVNVPSDCSKIQIGVWGDSQIAVRAQVHNEGLSVRTRLGTGKSGRKPKGSAQFTMPKRQWLSVTAEQASRMTKLIVDSILARLRAR